MIVQFSESSTSIVHTSEVTISTFISGLYDIEMLTNNNITTRKGGIPKC